jgi:hypothetical protein
MSEEVVSDQGSHFCSLVSFALSFISSLNQPFCTVQTVIVVHIIRKKNIISHSVVAEIC